MDADMGMDECPVPNVNGDILRLVARYMERHRNDPKYKPLNDKKGDLKACCTDPWDEHYFGIVIKKESLVV